MLNCSFLFFCNLLAKEDLSHYPNEFNETEKSVIGAMVYIYVYDLVGSSKTLDALKTLTSHMEEKEKEKFIKKGRAVIKSYHDMQFERLKIYINRQLDNVEKQKRFAGILHLKLRTDVTFEIKLFEDLCKQGHSKHIFSFESVRNSYPLGIFQNCNHLIFKFEQNFKFKFL